jgi:hypothetical protein
LRSDLLPDSGDDVRASVLLELASDAGFGFAEAVTQESSAAELLLPDRDTDVAGSKLVARVAEVHRGADRIGAESVVRQLNSPKGHFRQQRFDRLQLNRSSAFTAGRAGSSTGFGAGRIATVVHQPRV